MQMVFLEKKHFYKPLLALESLYASFRQKEKCLTFRFLTSMKSEQPLHHLERKQLQFFPRPLHQNRPYTRSNRHDTPRDLKEKELTNVFNTK